MNFQVKGNFYLYLVQKDLDLANSLGFMTLPVDEGTLFNIEEHEEVLITKTINLPNEIILTEQKLSEAYEVIVGYIDENKKEKQTSYQIKEVNVIKKK